VSTEVIEVMIIHLNTRKIMPITRNPHLYSIHMHMKYAKFPVLNINIEINPKLLGPESTISRCQPTVSPLLFP
jgi:hypothetical protein